VTLGNAEGGAAMVGVIFYLYTAATIFCYLDAIWVLLYLLLRSQRSPDVGTERLVGILALGIVVEWQMLVAASGSLLRHITPRPINWNHFVDFYLKSVTNLRLGQRCWVGLYTLDVLIRRILPLHADAILRKW
jgi:hypothetical protein